jgi:hypothetical protein
VTKSTYIAREASMKRLTVLVSALLASLAVVWVAPVGAQTLPPSLQGEVFVGTSVTVSVPPNCEFPPRTSTIPFTASGDAFGPYPGTFEESGTITLDVQGFGLGGQVVTGFQATFTIRDSNGDVVVQGTKSFSSAIEGHCGAILGGFEMVFATVIATYQATITPSAGGSYSDSGRARTFVSNLSDPAAFDETFEVSNGVLPLDTTGKATGGGQLNDVTKPEPVTFGFEVKQPQLGTLQGRCLINDPASNTHVKCVDVTSYQQVANTATWTGHAEVNGVVEDYRITVQDNAEPNNGTDTFAFDSTSYHTAGNVEHGNIQLHKQT